MGGAENEETWIKKEWRKGLKLNFMSQSFDSTVVHPREIIMNSAKAFMFFEFTWLVSRWLEWFCDLYFSRELLLYRIKTLSSASLRSVNAQNTKEGRTGLYINFKN